MKMFDITPKQFHCGIGACPAVFETDRGTYVLIGSNLPSASINELSERIGVGETAIEIPKELLASLGQVNAK